MTKKRHLKLCLTLLAGIAAGVILLYQQLRDRPLELSSRVISVSDGDTITVIQDNEQIKIRLEGIDCPERAQPFGTRAKQFTSDLALGKDVTILASGRDSYGRTLAEVILPDGRSLNAELLEAGLAWHYRYSNDSSFAALEAQARRAKRGLWADPHRTAPWDWRKKEQKQRRTP